MCGRKAAGRSVCDLAVLKTNKCSFIQAKDRSRKAFRHKSVHGLLHKRLIYFLLEEKIKSANAIFKLNSAATASTLQGRSRLADWLWLNTGNHSIEKKGA